LGFGDLLLESGLKPINPEEESLTMHICRFAERRGEDPMNAKKRIQME
jgi:hypothetical protein